MTNKIEVSANDSKLIASITKHTDSQEKTLQTLCRKAVKAVYSRQNSELAIAIINGIPLSLRAPVASWFRSMGLQVDLIPAKEAGRNGKYDVIRFPRDSKKQGPVFAKLETNVRILPLEGKEYKAPVVKELSHDPSEIEKRAKGAVTALINRLKDKDKEAGAALNAIWTAKSEFTEAEMCLITPETTDEKGKVTPRTIVQLSAEEWNAVNSFLHQFRQQEGQ